MKREPRPILVVFDTRHGQSAEIARHVQARLVRMGHAIDVEQTPGARSLTMRHYAAAVVIAPVYNRRHTPAIEQFARLHASSLRQMPTAFVSVSMGAAARLRFIRAGVRRISERLFESSHWYPAHLLYAAGSIDYPVYSPSLQRWMLAAAFAFGLPRDTSRRHELTNWSDVDDIVSDLVSDVEGAEVPSTSQLA